MEETCIVKIELLEATEPEFLPTKAYPSDAGFDIRSTVSVKIPPQEIRLIPAGFRVELPCGYEAQVRSRSGNALKKSIVVANSPGTIDSGYRGEVGVILCNVGRKDVTIHRGDRIAQMVIQRLPEVKLQLVDSVTIETDRGAGGFGSTGVAGN